MNEDLRSRLTPEQYAVTQEAATEAPFTGRWYECTDDGTYRCIVCSTPLFASTTKFDSGSGWPSFGDALEGAVTMHEDTSLGMRRTEVRCAACDAHLGHVFDDGPLPGGQRFCINSCALDLDRAD